MPNASDNLIMSLPKNEVKYLSSHASNNFFNYLYHKTDFLFVKEKHIKVFNLSLKDYSIKSTEEEAKQLYDNLGFTKVLDTLPDSRYKSLFVNYDLLVTFDHNQMVPMYVKDFKLFMDIGNLTPKDLENFRIKCDNK